MVEFIGDLLKLAEKVAGANVLTLTILVLFLGGYLAYRLSEKHTKFAKKCGIQKQLLTGYIQNSDDLSPGEAISKANKMTEEAFRDT